MQRDVPEEPGPNPKPFEANGKIPVDFIVFLDQHHSLLWAKIKFSSIKVLYVVCS